MPSKSAAEPKLKVEEVEEVSETPSTPTKASSIESTSATSSSKPVTSFEFADTKSTDVAKDTPASTTTTETKTMESETPKKPEETKKPEDWLNDIKPVDTPMEKSKTGKNILLVLIVLIILGGLVGGGIYYYQTSLNSSEEPVEVVTPQPTVSPEDVMNAEPTSTATESADLTKYSVTVLNGSGVTGEAKKVSTLLTDGGFEEDNITTGNASSSDFEDTEVAVKKDTPKAVFEKIKELLGKTYTVVESKTAVAESAKYDVQVTVGASK